MILAIPYLPGAADYRTLASDIRKRGPLTGHSLWIVSKAADADEAFDFGQELADLFDRTNAHPVELLDGISKIRVANSLFYAAMDHLNTRPTESGEPDSAILCYLDPQYRPTRNSWMKDLQSAYFFAGAPPVFGCPHILPNGETKVFIGPVVFSGAFVRRSALVNFLNDEVHWRMYLRSEMFSNYGETDLIGLGTAAVLKPSAAPAAKPSKS